MFMLLLLLLVLLYYCITIINIIIITVIFSIIVNFSNIIIIIITIIVIMIIIVRQVSRHGGVPVVQAGAPPQLDARLLSRVDRGLYLKSLLGNLGIVLPAIHA